jgi:hypothetical protein
MSDAVPQVFVLECRRGGHGLLASLGATHVRLRFGLAGDAGASINPWDVEDPGCVPAAKLAFLMRLHGLLLCDEERARRPIGLGDVEHELLAIAIRDVYARAADGEGEPSESLLREVLTDLARQERADPRGAPTRAAIYAELAARLRDVCAGGRFGHLLDRPTSVPAGGAPLVLLDIEQVPEEIAAALVVSIVEFVSSRAARAPAGHVALLADLVEAPEDEHSLRPVFPRESLLNGLHDSYVRRRMRAGEAQSIAYLHAISDVAHFLHPPTSLSRR